MRRTRLAPAAGAGRRSALPPRPVLADGMLKLMLILLAFFVFLHSRSELAERKVAPILDSLALRFAASPVENGVADPVLAAFGGDPNMQLRRRLLGHLPISAARVTTPGALLAFDLDEAEMFEGDGAAVRRERRVLLHRLAAVLAAEAASVQLTVTTAWPGGEPAPATARLAALQAILAEPPAAAPRMRLGFADLPAGRWRFVLRPGSPDAG